MGLNEHSNGHSKSNRWMKLSIYMGAFISHFTAGIVNVALPGLSGTFQTDLATVQWITTAYLLVISLCLPLMGHWGDRLGHRTVHNLGYLLFTVASVLVAFAPHVTALIVCRVLQAVGAAMFQSTNMALLTVHLPKEQRGRALGVLSTAVALGAMTGPIAGGLITEWLTWRWLFVIHVPAAVLATFLAYRYIPDRQTTNKARSLDGVGALCFAAAIGFLIFGVSRGGQAGGWSSAQTWMPFIISGISLLVLLRWESRHPEPFLPVHLMRKPMLGVGLAVSLISFALANAVLVAAPFYLMTFARINHAALGYVMTAYPILLAVTGPLAGSLSDRCGPKRLIVSGLGAMGAGSLLMALFLDSLSLPGIIVVLALFGTGMGLIASPNNSLMMNLTPAAYSGAMGSIIALTRNVGMVLGAAVGLGLLSGQTEEGLRHEADAFYTIFVLNLILSLAALAVFVLVALKSRRLAASGIDS